MRKVFLFIIFLVLYSCTALAHPCQPGPNQSGSVIFSEYFDDVPTWQELFPDIHPRRWNFFQETLPENNFTITSEEYHSEYQSLQFYAIGTQPGGVLSKSSIGRTEFDFPIGSKVKVTAHYWIPSGFPLKYVTILDLECWTCWDPSNTIQNQSPGIRLQMNTDDGVLYVDRGKLIHNTHFQQIGGAQHAVPRDRWFKLEWVLTFGLGSEGSTKVYIDGQLIIDSDGDNIMDPARFADAGIILTQTKVDSMEIGISANPQPTGVGLRVDSVTVEQQ